MPPPERHLPALDEAGLLTNAASCFKNVDAIVFDPAQHELIINNKKGH